MLKIRYNLELKQLSGWTNNEQEVLEAREGEATEVLSIPKPYAQGDYEHCYYRGDALEVVWYDGRGGSIHRLLLL